MARTKELTVAYGRKISDGNYGSVDFFTSETIELEEGDNRSKELRRLDKRVQEQGSTMLTAMKKAIKKKAD